MQAQNSFRFSEGFVGRVSEMRRLTFLAEDLIRGRGCVATVTGDPGIGKSYLLETFVSEISAEVPVLEGRCSYVEGAPPYHPWVEIISSYIGKNNITLIIFNGW